MPRRIDSARKALACLGVGALTLLLPTVAETKNCEVGSPASGVTPTLWGALEPADKGQLPDARDSSNYNGTQRPDDTVYKVPLFTSIDIENGWIFQSYTQGFKVWDARGGSAANPQLVATKDGQANDTNGFLDWLPGQHELRELIWDVDAPEGVDTVVATVSAPLGIQIWDTTQKGSPRQVYQDNNRGMYQVWSGTINGRHYAFTAAEGSGGGVHIYDMSAALSLSPVFPASCKEETPGLSVCPGVYKGRIGKMLAAAYIDGFKRADGKTFVVFSSGGGGFEIWDVSNPSSPQPVSDLMFGVDPGKQFIYGVAMWEQNGRQFLATQYVLPRSGGGGQGGRIYDVTNCLNGNCGGLTPIWQKTWSVGAARHFTTYSKSGNKHYLYFGNEDKCSGGRQREWLFDVSAVGSGGQPVDLTPPQTISVTNAGETATVDYWSWYYASNPSGFSEVMPRMGKVYGDYFYRAAWTIFDIHKVTVGQPPSANFTWSPEAEVYPGTPVTFNDTSGGQVTSRTWTFPDQSTASTASPTYTFQAAGSQPVNLTVGNGQGNNSITKNVLVLNPAPVISGGGASPGTARVCQPVTFTATATGRAPLASSWEVQNASNGMPVTTLSGNPATWNTAGIAPGTYRAVPTISNASGSATLPVPSAPTVVLQALTALPTSFTPSNDTFSAGTVQFHLDNVDGATEWKWDFGDGTTPVWTNDPVNGPNPKHSYTSTGVRNVKVWVRNCVETERVSQTLEVSITQINPLTINVFAAACNFNPCEFVRNQPMTFAVDVSGDPTVYKLDANGNGSFVSVPAPTEGSISHTYTQTTSSPICPKLRIERGAEVKEQAVTTCFNVVQGGPPPPPPPGPSISIAGASSGQANQALSFTASASNCTPSATWNWSATGNGSVSGSGNSVTVTWANDGNKTVSATNSGCAGASGSKSVTIGGGGPVNPGNLGANFTFTPASPAAGQAVSFNGTSSTGSPSIYTWIFGDGQTGAGSTVSHTYQTAGTYTVRLEVSKPGGDCPFNLCSASITKQVVVGNGGPPPPPPFTASFTSSANCISEFGINSCTAERGQVVTFTSTTSGATSLAWSFGDGGTATGAQVTHTWNQAGNYVVQLTAGNGQSTASSSLSLIITGGGGGDPEPPPGKKSVVLPWIAQTRGALVQSSDLYLFNPTAKAMDVTLSFLRRGQQETNPPRVTRTIQPGATLFVADVLNGLFNRSNIAGFITVEVAQGEAEPVITSFNTTFQTDGSQFGQTVPGLSTSQVGAAAQQGPTVQHLIGLNDNSEAFAYFGISNPTTQDVVYKLRFYNKLGQLLTQSGNLTVGRFGQRQYQLQNIRDLFHISGTDDYRVEVETQSGTVFPYGATVRTASSDPSFVEAGKPATSSKAYLVGIFGTAGIGGSQWQSDVVISNPTSEVVITDMRFIPAGVQTEPTDKVTLTLQPRETRRIGNVLSTQWGLTSTVGTLAFESNSPSGAYPLVRAEVYDNARPERRFGQAMASYLPEEAADTGKSQYLVGMRQDTSYRSTVTLYNPSTENATFDVVYRLLDGSVIGTLANQVLGGNRVRQLNPGQHPLPAVGVDGGLTIEIKVKAGKVLATGQVVNNRTNDPAYIGGRMR